MAEAPAQPAISTIRPTDNVVLFPTVAARIADGAHWRVELRVWVAIPAETRFRRGAAEALLRRLYGLEVTAEARPFFDRRIALLFADNKGGRRLVVEIAGKGYPLNSTRANGHSVTELTIPARDFGAQSDTIPLTAKLVLDANDPRRIEAAITRADDQGLSIISDIDDTVKISHVTDRSKLMRSTFLEAFKPVDGMAQLFERLGSPRNPVHYVSSTPWHFSETLLAFMRDSGLPSSELALKHVRIKDGTVFDLLASPTTTKPQQIKAILARFPNRRFVLVGDNGEKDPEIYGAIARAHPRQIAKILIRNCCPERASDARFGAAFKDLPRALWAVFETPDAIKADEIVAVPP
jgi:hypothetical protein